MDCKTLTDMACKYAGITRSELARRLDVSPQLLSQRLITGKLSFDDWRKIAVALGADPARVISFTFPDGKQIY